MMCLYLLSVTRHTPFAIYSLCLVSSMLFARFATSASFPVLAHSLIPAAVMAVFWMTCAHSATTASRPSPLSPSPFLLLVARYGTLCNFAAQCESNFQFWLQVHGSLARAGKVRGQTPKVAKQTDKPKRVRGRAKRRLQYNRRFKNIVVGAGGKKKVRFCVAFLFLLLVTHSCRDLTPRPLSEHRSTKSLQISCEVAARA